jgi:hypothetical protein
VVEDFDLEEHERTLLVQAVRTVDLLEQLDAEVRRDGPLVESPQVRRRTRRRRRPVSSASPWLVSSLPCGCRPVRKATTRPAPVRSVAWASGAPTASAG